MDGSTRSMSPVQRDNLDATLTAWSDGAATVGDMVAGHPDEDIFAGEVFLAKGGRFFAGVHFKGANLWYLRVGATTIVQDGIYRG